MQLIFLYKETRCSPRLNQLVALKTQALCRLLQMIKSAVSHYLREAAVQSRNTLALDLQPQKADHNL